MRQRSCLFLFIVLLPALSGCTRSAGLFSEQNARVHLAMLAGTIGSRPIGTEANARARAYLIDQLKLYGYEVRVQELDARRAEIGRTARVANIIAVLPGARAEAIGLLSHYDSVPESPGAADDGLGVAVSLEAARVLAARSDRTWTIFVLITDGEEQSLMGAAGLMTDREVTSRLQAYINVEAAGSGRDRQSVRGGPGQRVADRLVGAAGATPARRVVRHRNLPPAAERHGLHRPRAPGYSRIELRAGRRRVRVSHGARRARADHAEDPG